MVLLFFTERMMQKAKYIVCLIVFFGSCIWNPLPLDAILSQDSGFQQIIPLYNRPHDNNPFSAKQNKKNQIQLLDKLYTGKYGDLDDFSFKARIGLKTEKRPLVVNSKPFVLDTLNTNSLSMGWRHFGQMYSWQGRSAIPSPSLKFPLKVRVGNQSFQLDDFSELWFDYSLVPDVSLCMAQLEVDLAIRPYGEKVFKRKVLTAQNGEEFSSDTIFAQKFRSIISSIDATKSNWEKKGPGYLVGRALNLAPDANWHYSQNPNHAVFQHRLNILLDNVEKVDFSLAPGIHPEAVNMLVKRQGHHDSGKYVEFSGLRKTSNHTGGRADGLRLNFRDAMKKRFPKEWEDNLKTPGKHKFFLQEIIVFIPGEAVSLISLKPIRKIIFWGKDQKWLAKVDQSISNDNILTGPVVNVNSNLRRLIVDFRPFLENGEVYFKKATLQLEPPTRELPCAIDIKGVQLTSIYNDNVPVFAHRLENWSRRFGGLFKSVAPKPGQVENPGIIRYLPFHQFHPVPSHIGPLPYQILGPKGKEIVSDKTILISSDGATIRAYDQMPPATLEEDLLVVKGSAPAVDINWPLNVNIDQKTWFQLRIAEGAEEIKEIGLFLYLADGSVIKRQVIPNQPQRLVTGKAMVRNVKLQISPAELPYKYKLNDIALFEPQIINPAQAFNIPLPTFETVTPTPVLQSFLPSSLIFQPGHVSGKVEILTKGKPLHFSTSFEPEINQVRGIRFKYHFPFNLRNGQKCPLTLRLNWTKGKLDRHLCFIQPDGDIFIPIAHLLGIHTGSQQMGALQSIDWSFPSLPPEKAGAGEMFFLNFSIEGWAQQSFADQLRRSPLFFVGMTPIFANVNGAMDFSTDSKDYKLWLSLNKNLLSIINAAGGYILPGENDIFTIDKVMIEPKQQMNWESWRELIDPQITSHTVDRSKLLWGSVLVLLACLTRKYFRPFTMKLWNIGKDSVDTISRISALLFKSVRQVCWRWLMPINILVGFFALGLSIWLAWQFGWSFAGTMFLVWGGLVTWGAYCHWHRQRGYQDSETYSLTRINFLLLAFSIGCAVWSLAQFKLSYQTLCGILPIFGMVYVYLPPLYRLSTKMISKNPHYVLPSGWFITSMIFYGLGLWSKITFRSGENFFYVFGGLMMVITMRSFLLTIEPALRKHFPTISVCVYDGHGSLFFSGALLMLFFTTAVSSIGLNSMAEHLAIVVYYLLVIGVLWEVSSLEKPVSGRNV